MDKLDPVYIEQVIDIYNINKSVIYTGSFSLYLNGLINRHPKDIDIILHKSVLNSFLSNFDKSTIQTTDLYTSNHIAHIKNDYNICVFENKDSKYSNKIFNSKTLKLHDPLSILYFKLKLSKIRNGNDLKDINEIIINSKEKDKINIIINSFNDK